jgi:hypothetical protein
MVLHIRLLYVRLLEGEQTMLKFRLTSVAGLLAVTLTFCLSLLPAQAQEPQLDHFIYLPLILKSGATAPPGPYAKMLASVQQVCSATGPNQVCYVNGQITLEPKTGTIPFNQPGAIANLVDVQRLSLVSTGSDPQQWSLAWLRLAADSGTPDQELTVLAFGNVEISSILPFTGQPALEDETVLPSLQFASQPVAGITQAGSSGLIVANSTEDEVLSLTLNGAVVTLASTALVEAQPGSQMRVTMGSGVSNIEANGQSSVAVQGHQVTLPMNQTGQVSGPPAPAVAVDPLLSYALGDLLVPLTEEGWRRLVGPVLPRLNRAIDRCLAGQPAYIYNLLFWTRVIENDGDIKSRLDPAQLAQAYARAPRCLTFEVDFDSSATTQVPLTTESSHLHTQGLRMQFGPTGNFLSGSNQTLVYLSYQFNISESVAPCSVSASTTDGLLETVGGSLAVAGNRMRISSKIRVAQQPTDVAVLNCPSPTPPTVIGEKNWQVAFDIMHRDLIDPVQGSFNFSNWRYTGGEHFGEAIYVRTETIDIVTFDTTTYLIMIHTPQP